MKRLLYVVIFILILQACNESAGNRDSLPEKETNPAQIAPSDTCDICQDSLFTSYRDFLSKNGYALVEDSCDALEIRNDSFREAFGNQVVERCIIHYTDTVRQCGYILSFFNCNGQFSPQEYYTLEYGPEREEWIKAPYSIFEKGDFLILVYALHEYHRSLLEKHSQELQAQFDLGTLRDN